MLNVSLLHIFFIVQSVCSAGYFGKLCDQKCPSGTFGLQCGEICKCTTENCDHIKGCQLSTKISTYVTNAGII